MKKYVSMLLSVCLLCMLAVGCAEDEPQYPAPRLSPEQVQAEREEESVDIDLTELSSTMVYAEVYNIMSAPEDYLGQTIKMNGPYSVVDDGGGVYYHFIVIEDALACCQSGIEFKLSGDRSYPEDYPEKDAAIEATGVFGKYEEFGLTYYYLEVEEFVVL